MGTKKLTLLFSVLTYPQPTPFGVVIFDRMLSLHRAHAMCVGWTESDVLSKNVLTQRGIRDGRVLQWQQ